MEIPQATTPAGNSEAAAATAPAMSAKAKIALKFGRNNEFQNALRQRVDEYFEKTGLPRRDVPSMYFKTGTIFVACVVLYVVLVFFCHHWWIGVPVAAALGLAISGIGLNVQHDGGHSAYSRFSWVNKIMAMSLDLIGGSSYIWHYKHVLYHHTYVNITGHDTDVDLGALARFTPFQKRFFFHRLQHVYIWALYCFMAVKWHAFDDFREVVEGTIGGHEFPRPKGWDLVVFLGGKIVFFSYALAFPMLFHKWWVVVVFYCIAAAVMGIVVSVVFQLAHCVEEAEFPMPTEDTREIENAWAVHQAETTVDFARHSRLMAWLLGGLNYQVEHHLLPKICHVHFPSLSRVVKETCEQYEITFNEHRTFWAGVVSHFMWLREMGRPVRGDQSHSSHA